MKHTCGVANHMAPSANQQLALLEWSHPLRTANKSHRVNASHQQTCWSCYSSTVSQSYQAAIPPTASPFPHFELTAFHTSLAGGLDKRQHQFGTHLSKQRKNYLDVMVATEVLKAKLFTAHILGWQSPSQRYPVALPSLIHIMTASTTGSCWYHTAFISICWGVCVTNSKYSRNQRFWKIKFLANSGWAELIASARGGLEKKSKGREKSGRGIVKNFRNTLFQHRLNKTGWVFSEIPKCFISTFSHSCLQTAFFFYKPM